jgi:hypothetical protein
VDTHFLPQDGKSSQFAAVAEHSLCLFRYAHTISIEILDEAQSMSQNDWNDFKTNKHGIYPSLSHFIERPIRMATVRSEFVADILSRFNAMYIRIGSRDFTESTVEAYIDQMVIRQQ